MRLHRSSWPLGRYFAALTASAWAAISAAAPCEGEAYRAFDFWLGHWEVRRADGQLAGHNQIQLVEQGCVLHERYQTPAGYSGQSFTLYDASRERWHQSWVDNQGALLLLAGGLRAGQMVLEGDSPTPAGAQRNRISWSQLPDGRVRQLWQVHRDGAWQTVFDGYYQKVSPPAPQASNP